MLRRPYVSHRIAGGRHPTRLAKILPGVLRNLVCVGLGTPTALAFPQYLPVSPQGVIDIGIAAEAGIGSQNGALFLRLA